MAMHYNFPFHRDAETFRTYCHGRFDANLDYSVESVAHLDGILVECWENAQTMTEEEASTFRTNLVRGAGAYLGEVFLRHCDGQWQHSSHSDDTRHWWIRVGANGDHADVHVFDAVSHCLAEGLKATLLDLVLPHAPPRRVDAPLRASANAGAVDH